MSAVTIGYLRHVVREGVDPRLDRSPNGTQFVKVMIINKVLTDSFHMTAYQSNVFAQYSLASDIH